MFSFKHVVVRGVRSMGSVVPRNVIYDVYIYFFETKLIYLIDYFVTFENGPPSKMKS